MPTIFREVLIREGKTIVVGLAFFVIGFFTRDFIKKKKDTKDE